MVQDESGSSISRAYRLTDNSSVFQEEVLAVLKATALISVHVSKGEEITLYVDSQAALKA